MDIEVATSDVLSLTSMRLAEITVELDTYRVMVQRLREGNEELAAKLASYINTVHSLEAQIEDLGAEPVTRTTHQRVVDESVGG
jgi:hypothetical protein